MSENIDRSIEPISLSEYTADDIYHIKPVDKDSGRQENERFGDHLQQKEEENKEEAEKKSASLKELENHAHPIVDEVQLSKSAMNVLGPDNDRETSKTLSDGDQNNIKHINVTA